MFVYDQVLNNKILDARRRMRSEREKEGLEISKTKTNTHVVTVTDAVKESKNHVTHTHVLANLIRPSIFRQYALNSSITSIDVKLASHFPLYLSFIKHNYVHNV